MEFQASKFQDFLINRVHQVGGSDIKIAVGSCHDSIRINNTIFKTVLDYNPDVYVWLGDAVYLDRGNKSFSFQKMRYVNVEKSFEQKQAIFDITFNDWYYKQMKETFPIIGVWDDHDLGLDNSGKEYKNKYVQKQMYLDFIQEPQNSSRRIDNKLYEGVYQDYQVINKEQNLKVHVILLDVRFNMEPDIDVLGVSQWSWLSQKLEESYKNESDVILIGSGIQFLNYDNFFLSEAWDQHSRLKLLQLLISNNLAHKTIFMSGDVHYSQFLRTPCKSAFLNQHFHEFSSSGMTHNCLTSEYNCRGLLEQVYTNIWKDSSYYMYYNFVGVEVKRIDGDFIQVDMSIISNNGSKMINKTIQIQQEQLINAQHLYNKGTINYCQHRVTQRRELNFFLTWMNAIIVHKSDYILSFYIGWYSLKWSLQLAFIIWTMRNLQRSLSFIMQKLN
eukprot:403348950